jgi:putative ABC transport system ATP-binding protein
MEPCYLSFHNLTKTYQEGGQTRTILRQADAEFSQGEFVAILGKSGSGKSTLLNLIGGIDMVDEGVICMAGRDLTALSDHERTLFRRDHIGFIFQFFNLISTLTVLENVALPGELSGASQAQVRARAIELLGEVGLSDRLDTYPDRLSGGEQQRVAIARALINDPILLLADEPTGNLDEATGRQVLDLLDRLTRKAGKNTIMVTHSAEAAAVADRILYLRDGKLVS